MPAPPLADVLVLVDELRDRLTAQAPGDKPADAEGLLERLDGAIAARRTRDRLLPSRLFADPAWDVLLGLYRNQLLGRGSGIEDACRASALPTPTVLRWVGVLEREGLIVPVAGSEPGAVGLSPGAAHAVESYLAALSSRSRSRTAVSAV